MTKIKFPNLHKGVTKVSNEEFIVSDYIFIHKLHAFVIDLGLESILGIDLNTSFNQLRDPVGEDEVDQELEQALNVLQFLDGKFIPPDYWNELVTAEEMLLIDHVKEPYIDIKTSGTRKRLYYEQPELDSHLDGHRENYKKMLDKYAVADKLAVATTTVPLQFLSRMISIFGNTVKTDHLIVEHLGNDRPKRFTFNVNRHIFGLMATDFEMTQELFLSLSMENYIKAKL